MALARRRGTLSRSASQRRVYEFSSLVYSVDDGVAWIRLNRPDFLNAFTSQLYGELRTAVRLADSDGGVDTLVITGTGRAFGTGGDLAEGLEVLGPDADPLEFYRFADNLPYDAIRDTPKVVIAAVNGICMAGGLIAALTADIIVAVETATFGIPEGLIGMPEPWVPNMMFGRVSIAHLKLLALTGGTVTAREALKIGMIPMVVPDDDLLTAVRELIVKLRRTTPASRATYKEYINRLIPYTPASVAARTMKTPGALEMLQKYAEQAGERRRARSDQPAPHPFEEAQNRDTSESGPAPTDNAQD